MISSARARDIAWSIANGREALRFFALSGVISIPHRDALSRWFEQQERPDHSIVAFEDYFFGYTDNNGQVIAPGWLPVGASWDDPTTWHAPGPLVDMTKRIVIDNSAERFRADVQHAISGNHRTVDYRHPMRHRVWVGGPATAWWADQWAQVVEMRGDTVTVSSTRGRVTVPRSAIIVA